MAERRATVIRDVAALRKDARQAVDRYLAHPAADAVVVLIAVAGGKPDKALCASAAAVEYEPLSGKDIIKWVIHHASTAHGASITPEAASLLQSAAGEDLPTLAAELDKLASYASGRAIDEDAVTAVVGVRRGETLGDFLDHVARRDARGALALVGHVLQQPKTSAVSVVMALATQTFALAWAKARREEGASPGQLAGEFYDFLSEAKAVTGRPWKEAISAWLRALDAWTLPELDRALEALLAADCALKESRLSSDEQLLATLVLTLCAADPAPARQNAAA
jgi:DNA polymerase-3 subunit delta